MISREHSDRMFEKIKKEFSYEMMLNDEKAMKIIVDNVFSDSEIENISDEEAGLLIKKIFLKTRRRLGILQPLIEDEEITEIMVNGPQKIFIEKAGKLINYELAFDSTEELEEVIRNIAGDVHREINELNPIVDARLIDGSRVNAVYKNIAVNGPILTIRKFSETYITLSDLVRNGTISDEVRTLLSTLVCCGYNLFVSGGTSSGKTTLLNALAESIPKDERVIVIEDSMELKLSYIENIVHMETRNANSQGKGSVTMAQLIKSSLRMRPNRIIVGEIRGGEVVDMVNAMNSGHPRFTFYGTC